VSVIISGNSLFYLLLAAFAGIMMAIQGSINAVLFKKIGLWETIFFVHLTALIIVFFILIFKNSKINFSAFNTIPWYLYLGGIIGIAITYGVTKSIPELGVANATTSIISGQVLTATLIDHMGLPGIEKIPFTWLKVLGIIFLSLGVRLLLWK